MRFPLLPEPGFALRSAMARKTENRTIDAREIAHFAKDSADWWNPEGPFRPLHRLNPARLGFLRDQIVAHFDLDDSKIRALSGLKILDIGCGGGLVSEPLARLGADVTGIDGDQNGIDAATLHAKKTNTQVTYRCGAAEDLTNEKLRFDVVLALEVIEHVSDQEEFVHLCADLVRDGGLVIFSTLNRNPKSFAMGIVAAEYLLRWVPKGTHDWRKFLKPSELAALAENTGLSLVDAKGLVFNPVKNTFSIHPHDLDVNYFLVAEKL